MITRMIKELERLQKLVDFLTDISFDVDEEENMEINGRKAELLNILSQVDEDIKVALKMLIGIK